MLWQRCCNHWGMVVASFSGWCQAFRRTLEKNIHLQNANAVMVRVVCPHCQSEVTIDPETGTQFSCMWCNSNFQYEQDKSSTNLSPGTLWLSSTIDTENEHELMDGQKAHLKGLGWFVGISALFLIPFTILGGAAGFFSCFIFVAGSAAMAAFFSQTDSHEGLYYNTSTGMLTLVSTNEQGFWYVDKQVHKNHISSVEVLDIWLGEHQGSKLVLKIRGNGWVETMHAHGFKSKLFEELVGMEVQHKQAR